MSEVFADRLVKGVEEKATPICVGIDPMFELLPEEVTGAGAGARGGRRRGGDGNDVEGVIDAVFDFTTRVLKVVAPHVPCVKFQSAYFEKYWWEGVEAYYSLVQEARALGLLVIGDVKRGDIGSTAAAYAAGHLADPGWDASGQGGQGGQGGEDFVTPDAITVNPMLGLDTIEPFVRTAQAE